MGASKFICSSADLSDSNMAMKHELHKKGEEIPFLASGNKKGNPGLKPSV